MSDIKAHLLEVVDSLREYTQCLSSEQGSQNPDQALKVVQMMWDDVKQSYGQYVEIMKRKERLESLKQEIGKREEYMREKHEKLSSLQSKLKAATPKLDVEQVSAWNATHLAMQFPLTQHCVPTMDNIQYLLFLRQMPYSKQNRMPEPTIVTEPETVAKGDELVMRMEIPEAYKARAYIRYTTDGSVPTRINGLVYDPNNKPKIDTNMVIRAVMCHDDCFDSKIVQRVYMIDAKDSHLLESEHMKKIIDSIESATNAEVAIRPGGDVKFSKIKLTETPSISETPRPPSINPYIPPISTRLPTPTRQASAYRNSNSPELNF